MLLNLQVMPVSLSEHEERNTACSSVSSSLREAVKSIDRNLVAGGQTTGSLDSRDSSRIQEAGFGLAYGLTFRTGENRWEHYAIYMED
jgi:hypothetical protein